MFPTAVSFPLRHLGRFCSTMENVAVRSVSLVAGSRTIGVTPLLYIGGAFREAAAGKTFPTVNPATEEVLTLVAEGGAADVDAAVVAAQAALEGEWGAMDSSERGRWLYKLADAVEDRSDDFAHLESLDNGKTLRESSEEDVPYAVATLRYYAGWADKLFGDTFSTTPGDLSFTLREPLGVCGCIIPWNYPLVMLAWKIAPALACGNTVVLKSSEKTPLSAALFAEVCNSIGLPPGVFNLVSGYGPTGAALAQHRGVAKVAFTGSTAIGRAVMRMAAESNLKPVSLECGGKSPNIIFDDCDLEKAVECALAGIFTNQGQICSAGSRIFVQTSIYDEFLSKFCAAAKEIRVGDPFKIETKQGPQIDQLQFSKILDYIRVGLSEGAQLACGGKRVADKGYFIEPTLLLCEDDTSRVVREEIFGPVAVCLKFDTESEVLQRANSSSYGLAAAVFTQNINRAMRMVRKLKAGIVWVNSYGADDYRMPFGGFKESGFGRELGKEALDLYTQVKTVRINISE
eukprot:TRINITY_DN13331_c0_g1_i1.p1 TRINITY_DN13331_c0_g1~~TRINITY_DN13331_c0_g1_i1.p1  ORF type:complete len:516 (-),score=71.62 TRINITY_DN13331_c0_g1_i1:16-1563(-)